MACVSANDLPVQSALMSVHLFFGLLLHCLPSIAPRSITLVRPSDVVMCPFHFSFRRSTLARISSYVPILMISDGFSHMPVSDSVFAGDAKDMSEASQL